MSYRYDLTADDVASEVGHHIACAYNGIVALWVATTRDRDRFAADLTKACCDLPIVTHILRSPGAFTDPNVVMQDLIEVIRQSQSRLKADSLSALITSQHRVIYILISRSELSIPQASSPIVLPEWFPIGGGCEVSVPLKDITSATAGGLDSTALRIGGIREAIYYIDLALGRRMLDVARLSKNDVAPFMDLFLAELKVNSVSEWAEDVVSSREMIENLQGFRPSITDRRSVVARLWKKWSSTAPDALQGPAKAFGRSIGLEKLCADRQSLGYIFGRPTSPVREKMVQWALNIMLTTSAACQVSNASAHSAEYSRFPLALLHAVSLDICTVLQELSEGIDQGL